MTATENIQWRKSDDYYEIMYDLMASCVKWSIKCLDSVNYASHAQYFKRLKELFMHTGVYYKRKYIDKEKKITNVDSMRKRFKDLEKERLEIRTFSQNNANITRQKLYNFNQKLQDLHWDMNNEIKVAGLTLSIDMSDPRLAAREMI